MIAMRRACLILVLVLAAPLPANAHRLKVFATVEDGNIAGYGFFIGGGRPQGATVIMRDAEGKDLWRGETDSDGRFSWHPDEPTSVTVIVNARDGHVAETTINADRFAGAAPAGDAAASTPAPSQEGGGAVAPTVSTGCAPDPAAIAAMVDRAVDKAVERQVRPLLEAYDEASGAIRFNDIMGGIGMIVGLAGLGMWALSRRQKSSGRKD